MAPFYQETVDANGKYVIPKLASSDVLSIQDIYGYLCYRINLNSDLWDHFGNFFVINPETNEIITKKRKYSMIFNNRAGSIQQTFRFQIILAAHKRKFIIQSSKQQK